jgi:hypothetical protein
VPTLIDDLLTGDVFDDGRQIAEDLGLRPFAVTVQTETWSGGKVDLGTRTVATTTIAPRPRVRPARMQHLALAGGAIENGDRVVDRISLDYTRDQLEGRPWSEARLVRWLVSDGDSVEALHLAGLERRTTQWVAYLRRTARQRG